MFNDDDLNDKMNSHRETPLFKKALDILDIVQRIVKITPDDSNSNDEFELDWMERSAGYMMENAMIIPAKIAGAEGADIYDLRMENASIIRKAARELITDARGLQMNGFRETEYLDILREEVEVFRVLFAEWVKTFDPFNYNIDRWGLFNPPGVNYDDHDPDDDIPFDPNSFFDE